eukprot:5904921-Pyramimonas_sp.AAC.1
MGTEFCGALGSRGQRSEPLDALLLLLLVPRDISLQRSLEALQRIGRGERLLRIADSAVLV